MKKCTIISIILIGIILSFFVGFYLYRIKQIQKDFSEGIDELIVDECTEIAELEDSGALDLVTTNSKDEKTSPNCIITLKKYYQKCGHLIEKKETIDERKVNMKEEELRKEFPEWEIQKFTTTEIVLYKEINEFCNEHYLLKEKDGFVAIYKLDENNNERFIELTEIATKYLTEDDLEKIKTGMEIYTKKELNKIIEDFE